MQARAIFEAAAEINDGIIAEIMIPLVMMQKEFSILKRLIDQTAQSVMKEKNVKLDYMVGTMIELPRACLRAGEIAEEAEFFSFGTNACTRSISAHCFRTRFSSKPLVSVSDWVWSVMAIYSWPAASAALAIFRMLWAPSVQSVCTCKSPLMSL